MKSFLIKLIAISCVIFLLQACSSVSEIDIYKPEENLVLVTGITGNQGGGVANAVLDRGFKVRGLSRNISSDRSREWVAHGVEMVQGDFGDYDSIKRAVEGVDYLFLNISEGIPDFLAVASRIFDAAHAAGVRHIVLTTSRSANPESGFVIENPNHKRSLELYLRQSGYSYTTLRVPSMMENLMRESGMRNVLTQGLTDYGKEGTLSYYMCSRDMGLLAAAAFADPQAWNGREVNMASDALTAKQLAELLSELSGFQIQYKTAPWTEYSGRFAELLEFYDEEEAPYDIAELRKEFPTIQTLEEYLRSQNYGDKLREISANLVPAQVE